LLAIRIAARDFIDSPKHLKHEGIVRIWRQQACLSLVEPGELLRRINTLRMRDGA
jgi:hypothetical protein